MKRRTGLLFSSAVVLGLAGGTVGGFLIQRARPATPLPPYQRTLAQAVTPGVADPRDAKTDDGAKLDGDLRKLLLERPAGAHDVPDRPAQDWLTIGTIAEYYQSPDGEFAALNAQHFRRAAIAQWIQADGTRVEIELVQFRSTDGADDHFGPHYRSSVAGTDSGYVGVSSDEYGDGEHMAYGVVRHGNVVEQVYMYRKGSAPSTDEVMKITKDQADRL